LLPRRSFLFLTASLAGLVLGLTLTAAPALAQSSLLNSGLLHYDPNRKVITMAPLLDKVTASVVSI